MTELENEFYSLKATREENIPHWKNQPMNEMSTKELQKAKIVAQKKIDYFFNKMCTFDKLIAQLENEASKRDALLEDHPRFKQKQIK